GGRGERGGGEWGGGGAWAGVRGVRRPGRGAGVCLLGGERGEKPALEVPAERAADETPPLPSYAADLVRGVHAHQERIDELIAGNAQGWALERMPAVDRNLLRIGTFELLWADDIPDAVAISEAVQLARDLSTQGSPAFVTGLLARLLELKPTLTL